jgi:hypothetical protein
MLDYAAFPEQRQDLIRQILQQNGRVVCTELAAQMKVSVDSRVHVLPFRTGMEFAPVDMQGGIRDMSHFFHFQHNIDLVDPFEILFKFGKFCIQKFAQRLGDFDIATKRVV